MQSVVDTFRNAGRSEGAASQIPRRASFRRAVEDLGGGTIFAFKLVQLLAVLGLLGTSLGQLILGNRVAVAYHLLKPTEVAQIAHCALYAYLAVLGSLALFGVPPLNGRAYSHVSWILVLVWGTYMYRDVYPLATLNKAPIDTAEGPIFYAKFALLTIAAVLVPIFVPRKYVPANPKVRPRFRLLAHVSDSVLQEVLEPNPEQTASLGSLHSFTFLGPIIWTAWKLPHFTYDMLPPLADYDHLRNLVGQSFPVSSSTAFTGTGS